MKSPSLRWCGSGYFDTNAGSSALEDDFSSWTWSRADTEDGAVIFYDAVARNGEESPLALRFDGRGGYERFTPPAVTRLPSTGWGIGRSTRSEDPASAQVLRTLEDTPFYARSIVTSEVFGERRIAMHESLSLERFRKRWVQTLLPFRMPRAFR
jgi:carotenoid 1,2-hydratase